MCEYLLGVQLHGYMSTQQNTAVLATMQSFQVEEFKKTARSKSEYFVFSGIYHNGYQTIILCPSGSGVGRPAYLDHEHLRNQFIDWLKEQHINDWIEVTYGELDQKITRSSDGEI
jgi:hypothetical protein